MPQENYIENLQMPPVAGPRFASVEQVGQHYSLVYLYFGLQPYAFLIPHAVV